jgi:two-component system KDP operon response regulator KdpE
MLARILVIEDDAGSAELVRYRLEKADYVVRLAVDGVDGLRQAYTWQPDLIVLDVMLPSMSGWTVCERLRQITDVPIIFLTVLDQEKHVIHGLSLGGDDYVVKPCDHRELVARIEAVLRRQVMQAIPTSGVYVYDDLQIDFDRRKVTRGKKTISLTPLEFKLLACLAESPGKSYSHNYLLRRVWGVNHQSRNSLKLYIWYLRRKLERDPANPDVILTDHGVGYRLAQPQRQ